MDAFEVLKSAIQNTDVSYTQLMDSLTGITPEKSDNDFIMSARVDFAETIAASKYKPVDRPDPAIIDAAILYTWGEEELESPQKQLEKVDADYAALAKKTGTRWLRNRAHIKRIVIWKMENGWSDLYPKWWTDYDKSLSYFERTLASRLKALVKANLLIADATGVYRLSPILADNIEQAGKYWSIINGLNAITPNPTIKLFKTRSGIKNLLGIE